MIRFAVVVFSLLVLPVFCGESPATAPLGSPAYMPSPERPYGWRGDGLGRFGPNPPTTWSRARGGETKGVVWMTPMPNGGVSCPIIVGDKIFLTTEPQDLVCMEKQTGKVLWIRSCSEFEGLSEEDRKANAIYADKLTPLAAQLEKANTDAVTALNGMQATAHTSGYRAPGVSGKRDIEKQISEAQLGIDKKLFERYWAQAVFGFAGQTPTSDGKNVCVFYTTGVTACYDLEGNRKWIHRSKGGGSEHGNFASPLLAANKVVVWANELRAYDVATGKLAWNIPAKGNNTYGSMFKVRVGADIIAAFQCGYFARISDGKPVWGDHVFGDATPTPIVENGIIYAYMGYPKANDKNGGLKAFKVPANDAGKLTATTSFKTDWGADELVIEKKNPFDRGYTASPLLFEGLMYRMTEGGGLIVNDAATGDTVYRKILPMKPKTEYWGWAGASASPTLAGKNIYLMDNQGTSVVIAPGRAYKEIAVNKIEESKNGNDQEQNVSTAIFEGTRMYYRTPNYLYCIGDK